MSSAIESVRLAPADKQVPVAASASGSAARYGALAVILALTALAYIASVGSTFVYDDQGQIVGNVMVKSWIYVPRYFTGHVWQQIEAHAPGNYYRPLNLLWFRLNDAMFGLHPAGWHLAAILLHLLATYLVYCVALRLTAREPAAALTALLFGIHPIHHEVVAWVSGTTESLWAVFFLAAFLAYMKSRSSALTAAGNYAWKLASALLYAAALLSKEPAIMFPAVVFVYACLYDADGAAHPFGWNWPRAAGAAKDALLYAPVLVAYVAVRIHVLDAFHHPQSLIPLSTLLFTIPSILAFYARQWLFPVTLAEFYDLPLWPRPDLLHVVLPAAIVLVLLALLWRARHTAHARELLFASAWTLLLLLPALDVAVLPPGELVHDRYFYLPSFGAALLVALALEKLARGPALFGYPRGLVIAAVALAVPLCYSTSNAASYWSDEFVLFQHSIDVAPHNVTARNNYAIQFAKGGNFPAAFFMLKSLVHDAPDNWLANYNLGRVDYDLNRLDEAQFYLDRAMKIHPGLSDNYLQLGLIQLRSNQPDKAEANIRQAVGLRPLDPAFHFALGVVLQSRHDCPSATSEFSEALRLDPGFPHAQEQIDKCAASSSNRATDPLPGAAPAQP